MNIELRNLKVSPSLSEETTAYTATLYVDGKKAASCSNHGQGAGDDIWFEDKAVEKAVETYMKTLPPLHNPYGDKPYAMDIELFIGELIQKAEVEKQYRRWCKKGIVFQFADEKDKDAWRTLKTLDRARAVAWLEAKHPGRAYEILNDRFTPVTA